MKRIFGYLTWLHVLSFGATALAQPEGSDGELAPAPAADPADPASAPDATAAERPQPSAAGAGRLSARAAVDTEVPSDREDEELAEPEDFGDALRFRAHNTWFGPTGGLRIVDAGSAPAGTARLQFGFDYFAASDYLYVLDQNESLGGMLSLSVTPIEHVEAFASLSTRANSNDAGDPVLLQVAGDLVLGAKGFDQILPWLGVGGDIRFLFLNTIGDLGVILDGTSVGFRAAASADLRQTGERLPLVVRANVEYLLDNSSTLIEGIEEARYESLPPSMRNPIDNEDRHLVTRIERFALGINRVDMFSVGLGVEVPLRVLSDLYLQPVVEWRLGVPVNRQGYSCLAVTTSASSDSEDDGCLAIEGLAAAPSTLTVGLRVLPPLRGLSALLAFDLGLLGTSTFVRELAPNRPWAFMFALGYAIDARPPVAQVRFVHSPAPPPTAPVQEGRIRGTVVERGFGTAVVGAIVRYPDHDLSPQLTGSEGRFVSYALPPGHVTLEITHPDYDPGRCSTEVPQPSAAQPSPAAPTGSSRLRPAGVPQAAAGPAGETLVDLRCELTARPRSGAVRGAVVDEKGAPVAGVTVEIAGPSPQTVVSDAGGSFALAGLPIGDYVARVDAPAYLLKSQPFSVTTGGEVSLQLSLVPKPKDAAVTLTAREVKIRDQIMFKSNSAEIEERSSGLLIEIADVLLRNPQVQVQVQGHTDNRGDSAANLELSQRRAEAVVQSLVSAGVPAERLEAKGYGDTRPLVPNLTPGNRARNRRVQFMVKE